MSGRRSRDHWSGAWSGWPRNSYGTDMAAWVDRSPPGNATSMAKKIFIVSAFVLAGMLSACGSDDIDTEATGDTIEESAEDAREAAENAFVEFRTGGERLVDEIRTRNAPEAKQQLLDRCRDALERLREADSDDADRVDALCDRIRDTDIQDSSVWDEIKEQIEQLN